MRCPTSTLKQPKIACLPAATMPHKGSQTSDLMPKVSREEAVVEALFQRLPKMLASLESFSEQ